MINKVINDEDTFYNKPKICSKCLLPKFLDEWMAHSYYCIECYRIYRDEQDIKLGKKDVKRRRKQYE